MMRRRGDRGETLVEILFTVIIVGLTVTALVSSLATLSNAGNSQRNSVRADVVLRNYAEATKLATQNCVAGAAYTITYAAPTGYAVSNTGSGTCPPAAAASVMTLTVDGPSGLHDTMDIRVRTP